MTGDSIRILVVEDHQIVRQGLVALLSVMDGVEVVGQAADGAEAVKLWAQAQVECTQVRMPG